MKLAIFLPFLTSLQTIIIVNTTLAEDSQDQKCSCNIRHSLPVIYGADFNVTNYATRENLCDMRVASNLINGTILGYYNVDFGNQPTKWLSLTLTNSRDEAIAGEVYAFIDKLNSHPVATTAVSRLEFLCQETILTIDVTVNVTGIHDVFLLFTVFSPRKYEQVVELNWFTFSKVFNEFQCTDNQLLIGTNYKQRHF